MTHEERVRHHLYETNEGILEHAERIAALEELVLVLRHCADGCGDCDACPVNDAHPATHAWFGCDTLREMMRRLGLEEG